MAHKTGLATGWQQLSPMPGVEAHLVLTAPSFLAGIVVDEADKPMANAEVSVAVAFSESTDGPNRRSFNYLAGKAAKDSFAAKSGADGRFRIEGFPTNASANLSVRVPGKTLKQTTQQYLGPDTMQCRAGQDDIRLVLEPAGSLEGKITLDEPGQPVPVAQLSLMPDGPSYFNMEAREPDLSQADGTFRIAELPAGSYRLHAMFGTNAVPDWVSENVPVTVDSGQVTRGVQLTGTRGGFLEIAVHDTKERKPISKVMINAYAPNYQAGQASGSNGLALLRVPAGDYQINAFQDGRRAENTNTTVESGKTNRVEFELAPAKKLIATVRRPNGQPASNLVVRIMGDYSMQEANLKTGTDGHFEAQWNSQNFGRNDMTPCVLIRDPERNLAIAQDIDEDGGPMDLKLAPGMTLVGRVECDGKPVTNATAALVFWTGNSGMHLNGLTTGTNEPGHFEMPALPPGRRYGLYVSAPGYGQKYVNIGDTESEPKRVDLDPVELRVAKMNLAGKLVDANDKPVAGAYVQIAGDDQPNSNARTDREGRFSFDKVCEGQVHLYANSANANGNMTAEAGDTNVVLKLGENMMMGGPNVTPQKLKGTVNGPDQKPIADAQVQVFPFDMGRRAKTDTNGAFSLTWVMQPWQRQMGNPMLMVRQTALNLASMEEFSEDTTNITVQLKPAWTITGQIEGTNGPLAGAQVGLWVQAGRSMNQLGEQLVPTDAHGQYTIKALPPDQDYTVFAHARNYGQSRMKVQVESETNRIVVPALTLKFADRILAGQVVNQNDKPVSGANVSLNGDDQPQGYVTTDSKGRFHFQVCEGKVQLFANSGNGFANTSAEAGDTNVIIQLGRMDRGGGGGAVRQTQQRPSLKGKPLPDLAPFGIAADATPDGKPILLCLMDIGQRPSRRIARLLTEQQEALRTKGISLLAVQAVPATADAMEEWKSANPVLFPVGQAPSESSKTRWASEGGSLPWLILTDSQHHVTAEGFALEDLDSKIEELPK
jgi:hypothetical protein